MTKKKEVDTDMVSALEVVLQQAEWVGDRLDAHLKDEYDIDEYVSNWIDEAAQESLYEWLDNKYEEIGPDDSTLESIVKDACQEAVKKYMTEQIMLALLDEVRANMGKLLGRAVKDYIESTTKGESK
jgi:hypothetical protein